MFIPTEGVGSAIAAVLRGTCLTLDSLEFTEDRAIAVFSQTGASSKHDPSGQYPVGPWEKAGGGKGKRTIVWRCRGVEASTEDIAAAFGISRKVMYGRLVNGGYAVTQRRHGKRDRIGVSDRLAIAGVNGKEDANGNKEEAGEADGQ